MAFRSKLDSGMDDDYWNTSTKGFSFEEDDSNDGWSFISTNKEEAARLSAHVKKQAHFENCKLSTLDDCLENQEGHSASSSSGQPLGPKVNDEIRDLKAYTELITILPKSQAASPTGKLTTPDDTVKRIILGQPFFLEQHKSKEDKIALLDEALRWHDGNAIITIILFLKRTLKPSLFNQELMQRPKAISHYLSYLRSSQDFAQLMDVLGMLGRTEEAAMVKYNLAISTSETKAKLRNLQNCLKAHFQPDISLSSLTDLLHEQITLLERQMPIEAEDEVTESQGKNVIMVDIPRSASVIGTSLIATLYYCCLYHYNKPEGHIASPNALKVQYNLTDKQFMWTALAALTRIKHWTEIDNLFQSKSWLGRTKMTCCIGFDKAVDVLVKMKAPTEVLTKYLRLVDDVEKRLNLAKKYECHGVVIDTLVSMRDRQALHLYKQRFKSHALPFLQIQEALNSSSIKWKN